MRRLTSMCPTHNQLSHSLRCLTHKVSHHLVSYPPGVSPTGCLPHRVSHPPKVSHSLKCLTHNQLSAPFHCRSFRAYSQTCYLLSPVSTVITSHPGKPDVA
ncbi:unnamed protein product [Boreogadus saida]